MRHFSAWRRALTALGVVAVNTVAALAADPLPLVKSGPYNADHATVELFAAMESGEIDVKLIANDSTSAQVLIENKTQQPLNVKLPAAFAGVPVLAQFQQPGGGFFGGNQQGANQGGNQGGQNQTTGGGFGNNQQNGRNNGAVGQPNGNFFNVPAERVGKLKVKLVCLEHGKPEPRAAIPYKIVPIAAFTDKPELAELCSLLGQRKVSQKSAQFAAWHLANEMTLEELASKKIEHLDGSTEQFFTTEEVRGGKLAVTEAEKLAKQPVTASAAAQTSTSVQ